MAIFNDFYVELHEKAPKTPKKSSIVLIFRNLKSQIFRLFEFFEIGPSFAKNFEFFVKNGPEFRKNFGKKKPALH